MFNLIQGLACEEGRHTFPIQRVYFGDAPRLTFESDFELRAKLPTLVMEEGAPYLNGLAHFVNLSDFIIHGRDVSFSLQKDAGSRPFNAGVLDENRHRHGLSDTFGWQHTCWQFGRGDIYRTLYQSDRLGKNSNSPKVFTLRSPPEIEASLAACMMPFATKFDDIYDTIKAACEESGLSSLRVDEIYGNRPIIADVVDTIDRAAVVICDLSEKNPNVLYETGVSHAIGREVIIIAQDIQNDVPFDLRHLRCISYDGRNKNGREQLQRNLVATIRSVLAQ